MKTHAHTQPTKTAIGYIRVSTQEQTSEGVSQMLSAIGLTAYCKSHAIKLIDIKADEGISGSTLERLGLQAALQMLRACEHADRRRWIASRSLRDVCALVDDVLRRAVSPAVALRAWSTRTSGGADGAAESRELQPVRTRADPREDARRSST